MGLSEYSLQTAKNDCLADRPRKNKFYCICSVFNCKNIWLEIFFHSFESPEMILQLLNINNIIDLDTQTYSFYGKLSTFCRNLKLCLLKFSCLLADTIEVTNIVYSDSQTR